MKINRGPENLNLVYYSQSVPKIMLQVQHLNSELKCMKSIDTLKICHALFVEKLFKGLKGK